MSDKKFIDLETRIAFLEDAVDDLNKLAYQQSKEILQYQETLKTMSQHVKQVQSDIEEFKPQNEVPPHY
ncbi:SlyX family protein [Marinicella sp. S1101]|uniref:SlyX family protein n=1 Tax=Marinicella marina TaxID=2996016 RepID=UPI002260AD58|nr:SlyX family protein [Marinicella marina]MCX7553766.1 SlyX family protein [Marinicella marina]MDJ1140841.1 SlyX family protein [Marinicella marina]